MLKSGQFKSTLEELEAGNADSNPIIAFAVKGKNIQK
jgi:hypothetical protein